MHGGRLLQSKVSTLLLAFGSTLIPVILSALAEDEYPICCLFERDAVSLTPETATYTSPKPQLGRGLFARQEVGASVSVSPTAH